MLHAALAYAHRGWQVFPLHGIVNGRCTCGRWDCSSPGKHPLTRHGVKDSSIDPDVIREWWTRWPAANVGIATGECSRLVVIDVDLPRALSSLDAVIHKLPRTLTALTGGGGIHLLYRGCSQERVRNRTSSLPGMADLTGIDLRGDGGYIVAPPSFHVCGNRYEWLALGRSIQIEYPHDHDEDQERDESVGDPLHAMSLLSELADAPAWLVDEARYVTSQAPPSPPRFSDGDGTPYGLAALADEVDRVRTAAVGTRNHTLNRAAFCLAQLVAGGELSESVSRPALIAAALAAGLTEHEIRRTIASAFGAGVCQPRSGRLR